LEKFKKRYGIIQIMTQNDANIGLLKALRENQAMVEAKLKESRTKVGVQARNLAQTGDIGAFTKEFQNNILEELVRVLAPLLAEKERLALHYQKSSAKYRAADRQVQEIKAKYRQQIQELLKGAQLDINAMTSYLEILTRYIKDIESKSLRLSQNQIEYEGLVREVKQNEKNYLMYLNKTEEARIEEQQDANRVSNVTVTTWGHIPTIPIFPRKFLMLLLAGTLGFIVALAGSFFAYYLDHTLKTPQDLARYSHLPVFATIDLVKWRPE
jgi:succinoglycan biosynthesis transport protein ExoP